MCFCAQMYMFVIIGLTLLSCVVERRKKNINFFSNITVKMKKLCNNVWCEEQCSFHFLTNSRSVDDEERKCWIVILNESSLEAINSNSYPNKYDEFYAEIMVFMLFFNIRSVFTLYFVLVLSLCLTLIGSFADKT